MKKTVIIVGLLVVVAKLTLPEKVYSRELGDSITLGDSLTAGLARISGVGIVCAAQGNRIVAAADQRSCKGNGQEGVGVWQPRLKSLSQGLVYNYGNTGETTGEMISRFNSHLNERDSEFVLILAGTNDMIFGNNVNSVIANIGTLVQTTLNAGRKPIVATLPPLLGGSRASSNPRVVQLNQLIRELPSQYEGLVIAELYNQLISGWPNTYSADTVHFNDAGNQLVAQIWFEAMQESLNSNAVILAPIYDLLLSSD